RSRAIAAQPDTKVRFASLPSRHRARGESQCRCRQCEIVLECDWLESGGTRRPTVTTMRLALCLAAVCISAIIDAQPSFAEAYRPWCVVYSGRGGRNCGFTSYEQCAMTATPGTRGSCVQNPWYLWYGPNSSSAAGRIGQPRRRGECPLGTRPAPRPHAL